MTRKRLAVLLTAALLALGCGAGETPSITGGDADTAASAGTDAPPTPHAVQAGQPLTVDTAQYQATYTLSKVQTRGVGDYGQPGHVYVLAHLRVEVTEGNTYACSCDLSHVAADNRVTEAGYLTLPSKPMFNAVELTAGQNADGWIIFEVPKQSVDGARVQLKVSSLLADTAYGYWQL